ncbi:hypothetical protein BFP97_09380 [Roseivirga sp. 4D4]|uniref:sulfurtransferase n=1 Tax=Roseivirga sp. 4D4 TaxID=1889784 RepID=UPI0008534B14|nr:rhodanese-like domain-containing protein [Roseivirga sp. 4D4]OEK01714.1 hypothetical protein BFP97_09380 [Roseivirga sp. 4D4]
MKTRAAILILTFCFSITTLFSQKKSNEIFVDQQWFQTHQSDDDLVLLHVADPKSYEEGHIEGAISIVPQEYTVVRDGLYWELPELSKMDSTLRSKGVTNDSQLILYYGGNDHAATFRLFFTLDYFGLSDRVRILDGGLKGWKANDLALSTDKPAISETTGKLKLKPKKKIKVDKNYARKSAGKDKINLIDARRDVFYNGTEMGQYKRGGHIMGAGNICWLDIVDENMFVKDKTVLAQMYAAQGVGKGEQVVAYCHVGLRASTIYTIAKYLGFQARLYDGSFNEWDTLPDEYAVER